MSTSEALPKIYRGHFIDYERDEWRNKHGDFIVFSKGNEIDSDPGFHRYATSLDEAKEMIDDWIAEKEAKSEAFQTKGALQYLIAVLEANNKDMSKFFAEHPWCAIDFNMPSYTDSLNYKWTQWAKQKIENLK